MPVRSLLRVFLAVLWLWPAVALAQVEQWRSHMDAGDKAYLQYNYPEAEKRFTAALKEAEQFGPEDLRLATTLSSLAEVYRGQGQPAAAESLHKRSLAILEKALGPEHPDVAQSLNKLAWVYMFQRRSAEAILLLKRALEINEKVLGPEHPDVGQSFNNLALLHQHQGRFAEAEPLHKRALAIREKALGPEHPDVASSLNNLAGLYNDQGRYGEAEPLLKRALAIEEKALGPENTRVAITLNNLAFLYKHQGKYAEAEPLYKRSLAILEKALGPEHPDLVRGLKNYAALLRKTGRGEEAKKLAARVRAIRTKDARERAQFNALIPSLSPAPADTSVQPAVGVYPKTNEEIGFTLTQTFLNPTPAVLDLFGYSVAISGDKVLVGAKLDDAGAKDSGAVYLFDAGSGKLLHTFLNPTPAAIDYFGGPVAISSDKVLVGAALDDAGAKDSGAAYLFDVATVKLLHTFLNPTPAISDEFGSVAISGDKVLIGAFPDDAGAKNSGAAYLFDAATGKLLHTFLNPTPAARDSFGGSVDISGDKVLIGAGGHDAGAINSGAAYLFDAATGKLLHTFLNPRPAIGFNFGYSVAISGDKVLVGAKLDDAGAKDSGAAYLFDAGSGKLLHTFLNPTRAARDYFGDSVAISGNKVLVGARLDDAGAKNSGAAYLFDAATGKLLHTFLNPTPAAHDYFGSSVAISGDKVLIGAWGDDAGAKDSGAAYLFLPGPTSPRQTAPSK